VAFKSECFHTIRPREQGSEKLYKWAFLFWESAFLPSGMFGVG
jgi:hypothetical protein